ncbi:MAG: DHHA1 domain-containing protein [Owenweeksia sp.]|nr:DHHA1 domain-containing protein [Owenweeksia sp.]
MPDTAAVILSLSANDLHEFDYQKGDTEGFVNYGLSMEGVELSIFVYQKGDLLKMSFRSKTDFDVNQFAREHFDGGGHLNAAGGVSRQSLNKTISKLKTVLKDYADELPKA